MTDRKKPGWAFWTALGLAVLLVGYPLSFGPACWMHEWKGIGEAGIPIAYYPIIWLAKHSEFGDLINWYAKGGRALGKYPAIVFGGQVAWCWDVVPP
ncbi:MAG TPA: hypothetical protein VGM05_03060 [Planctomycetaceae bacterium]|jgi:hypothetical protein